MYFIIYYSLLCAVNKLRLLKSLASSQLPYLWYSVFWTAVYFYTTFLTKLLIFVRGAFLYFVECFTTQLTPLSTWSQQYTDLAFYYFGYYWVILVFFKPWSWMYSWKMWICLLFLLPLHGTNSWWDRQQGKWKASVTGDQCNSRSENINCSYSPGDSEIKLVICIAFPEELYFISY